MSTGRCRAKNPARCRSPRCPGRSRATTGRFAAVLAPTPTLTHREALQAEKQASENFVKKLSDEEKTVLFDYTNQSYTDLNQALRKGSNLTVEQKKMVRHLDTLFSRSANSDPRLLLRSIRPPENCEDVATWVQETFPVGKTVTFPAYGSTTVSKTSLVAMLRERPDPPSSFMWTTPEEWEKDVQESVSRNVVLELVTKEGISVSTISHMPQETEILLPRGQSYAVHSVDQYTYESDEHILTGDHQDLKRYPATRVRLVDKALL